MSLRFFLWVSFAICLCIAGMKVFFWCPTVLPDRSFTTEKGASSSRANAVTRQAQSPMCKMNKMKTCMIHHDPARASCISYVVHGFWSHVLRTVSLFADFEYVIIRLGYGCLGHFLFHGIRQSQLMNWLLKSWRLSFGKASLPSLHPSQTNCVCIEACRAVPRKQPRMPHQRTLGHRKGTYSFSLRNTV